MDKESQKRKIKRFIGGTIKDRVDAFCIYQWVERCHFEGWWKMGFDLGSHLQPNSLNKDYEKRLDFILLDCRRNHDQEIKAQNATIGERIDTLSEEDKNNAMKLFAKLGIDMDTKIKDVEHLIDGPTPTRKVATVDDLTGKIVRGFTLCGKTYRARNHKEAYLNVLQLVFQQNPLEKNRILRLQGRKRKYFSCNPKELTKYRERIPDSDIYAELNENANTLYRRGKEVLQLYEMEHSSFKILTD